MPESTRRLRTMQGVERAASKSTKASSNGRVSSNRRSAGRLEVEYVDNFGRKFVVYVDDARDDPALGHIKGPMPLDSLNLPQPLMVRLHNELYARGLITTQDVMRRPTDVEGAYKAALRVDIQSIQQLYKELGS